ncbi:hypothetical protein AZF06_15100 [Priestia endophytica]|nr:hypothetical protein AZF06_15100 [Priestia endophytica]
MKKSKISIGFYFTVFFAMKKGTFSSTFVILLYYRLLQENFFEWEEESLSYSLPLMFGNSLDVRDILS